MKKNIFRYICTFMFFVAVFFMFFIFKFDTKIYEESEAKLVVFGDNIATAEENIPFVKDTGIYLSVDTISKLLDEKIYYDKLATKIIVTTKDKVLKFKINEKKMTQNFVECDIENEALLVNESPFIDILLLKDIYGIRVEYNEELSTISIDKLEDTNNVIKNNMVYVYSDLSTNSDILCRLNKNSKVIVYTDSLNHNRWYKIKTDTGIIGYISKNNVDVNNGTDEENTDNLSDENSENKVQKINMFWQYGSNISTLGEKIEGVNVVSPTWYELKNSLGDITSESSTKYYNKAKENGYEIWPIITNGIDSVNYTADDTSAMLNSETNRENFIKNLLDILKKDKVDGINIDFEAMYKADRDVYTQFIRELSAILRNEGIKVSVDMYFVEYIDRKRVGEAVDYCILMGYDQRGNWSSEEGSISEVPWVEDNVKSLINDSNINAEKIILGVPFYTRLWNVKNGESEPKKRLSTTVYTMSDCKTFLKKYELTTTWDEKAKQNYAEYTSGNTTYKLWIEDADSIKERVNIVNNYNLAGICGWRKGLETSDIWQVINENLER